MRNYFKGTLGGIVVVALVFLLYIILSNLLGCANTGCNFMKM